MLAVLAGLGLAAGGAYAAKGGKLGDWSLDALSGKGDAAAVPPTGSPTPVRVGTPRQATAGPSTVAEPTVTYAQRGTGTWRTAKEQGAVAGRSGQLLRYRVAVEGGIGNIDLERFAGQVAAILADPRGWTGGGRWRLQRVGPRVAADFTVQLATPVTRSRLCGDTTDLYTSCRVGDQVVLNVARWVRGVPQFGGDLTTYRQYLVTHEVGHRLGHGHELCPKAGGPAPVMQQQTLGLHGCLPNAWPRPKDADFAGPPGAYDDPIPTDG
ncbi:DUF3152 domain-containing protein [Micromonospora zhanjiangensis]